jgi:hypothetical protein
MLVMGEQNIKVEVNGRFIVVTMPSTLFRATYFKSPESVGLVPSDHMTDDFRAAVSRNEFLSLAWRAAHDVALARGWLA